MLKKLNQKPHSVTYFKINVTYAFKLAQGSTCSARKNTPCNIALDKGTRYASALTLITFERAQRNSNSSRTHSSSTCTYLRLRCIQTEREKQ